MRNAGLDEAQARIKIAKGNINNFRYADDTNLIAESEEELKSLLMKVKGESEKAGLNLNIQTTTIMVSSPNSSQQIDGKTMETVTDSIFLGFKITADGDCSHEIKIRLLLGRKVMTNLDSIFKSRDINLPTKVRFSIALTRWTFVGKVMSLLLNMLSRLVITFLPRSKHLLISWLQLPSVVILETPQNKVCHCFHCFPIYLP